MKAKVIVEIYDPEVREAPFKLIKIDEFETLIPQVDDGGLAIANHLTYETSRRGYHFKFYTIKDEEYHAVVHNFKSSGSNGYLKDHLTFPQMSDKDNEIMTKMFMQLGYYDD